MTAKNLFYKILEGKSEVCGFWHGHPHENSKDKLFRHFNVKNDFDLGVKLKDTVCWCMPEELNMYRHPEGKPMFDVLGGEERHSLNQDGVFAHCEDTGEIDGFCWPDLNYVDYSDTLEHISRACEKDMAVLSGSWSSFFHVACDMFGMENYFVKMHTHPEIVLEVTDRVVDFYLKANEKLYALAGDKIDALFFGNDFGSQLDMLISPASFNTFVMPYFERLVRQAKSKGYKVVLHSCGAISKVIPQLIEAGVDVLHPIQAKAKNMDAESLASAYKGRIVFMGGVDTQELLTFGSPKEIKEDVKRLVDTFGTNFIVSPSHECILPNVPPENIEALAEAVSGME